MVNDMLEKLQFALFWAISAENRPLTMLHIEIFENRQCDCSSVNKNVFHGKLGTIEMLMPNLRIVKS